MAESSGTTVLHCQQLSKSYASAANKLTILRSVNLRVHAGERIGIVGRSGAGKSTLLTLLGGLDTPDSGSVYLLDKALQQLSERELTAVRNQHLGFVYQFHHLLGEFSALENVALPLLVAGAGSKSARTRATAVLAQVGLDARLDHYPAELSGGERQRVAIARALVAEPDCVLLDEPTGNLDGQTAAEVQQLMLDLSSRLRTAFITVTHDTHLAAMMDKVYVLADGSLNLQSEATG